MMLEVQGISVRVGGRSIVHDVSFGVTAGEKLMVIGPNGAGKTTLIRAIMQTIPHAGAVTLLGKDVSKYKPVELARHMGVLTQSHNPEFSYSVRDVVSLGRYAYRRSFLQGLTETDEQKIAEAMQMTGVGVLADASVQRISGGELQRVFLAQLLAQDPDVLILDEPTNNLDLSYQIAVFDILDRWVELGGKAVISVIHDLNLVYRYATKALLMYDGERAAYGTAEEVLSPDNLNRVYHMDIAGWMKGLLHHWEKQPC